MEYNILENKTLYDKIRNLDMATMEGAWIGGIKKGESYQLCGEQFIVTTKTPKTIRIKNRKSSYGFRFYSKYNFYALTNQAENFLRDLRGEIMCDLINEHNPLHTPSTAFYLTAKAIKDKI